MTADRPIRVLIVDDEAISRLGVAALLDPAEDIEVLGEAADGREGVDLARSFEPDVVLMDLAMPEMSGVEATRRIVQKNPRTAVVLLSGNTAEEQILEGLRAGAIGYLSKRTDPREIAEAIRRAHRGHPTLPSVLSGKLLRRSREPPDSSAVETLTGREFEVVELLARGLDDPRISERLSVSEITIRSHVHNILGKLGLASRVQLVLHALREGWVALTNSEDPRR